MKVSSGGEAMHIALLSRFPVVSPHAAETGPSLPEVSDPRRNWSVRCGRKVFAARAYCEDLANRFPAGCRETSGRGCHAPRFCPAGQRSGSKRCAIRLPCVVSGLPALRLVSNALAGRRADFFGSRRFFTAGSRGTAEGRRRTEPCQFRPAPGIVARRHRFRRPGTVWPAPE